MNQTERNLLGDKHDLKLLAIPWDIGGNGPEQPHLNHVGSRGPCDLSTMQSLSGAILESQHRPSPYMVPYGDEGSEISNVGVEIVISPGSSSYNGGAALNPPTLSPNAKEEKHFSC
eukprot:8874956-Ditylum_brightwellii.AAC.1